MTFGDQVAAELPALDRYAFFLMRDRIAARELVQDTVARALLKQHLWAPGTKLRAWLFTVMKNQRVNGSRSLRRLGVTVDVESVSLPAMDDPEIGLVVRDLRAAISRLSLGQRRILALVCYRGLTYEEAAAVLRVPLGTVRSRLSRARVELRATMGR